jgi:uncharacterized protein (TIGR03437 family)
VNARVPEQAHSGVVSVVLRIGNSQSQPGVTVAVQ